MKTYVQWQHLIKQESNYHFIELVNYLTACYVFPCHNWVNTSKKSSSQTAFTENQQMLSVINYWAKNLSNMVINKHAMAMLLFHL